jgi:hypothetical protein
MAISCYCERSEAIPLRLLRGRASRNDQTGVFPSAAASD